MTSCPLEFTGRAALTGCRASVTAQSERTEVAYLRNALELTPATSRHLAVLEEADLIQIERGYHGRRSKTWIRITQRGRIALTAEINALRNSSTATNGRDSRECQGTGLRPDP
jgi:DNA-binding MarR family transcriptional regulator